MAGAGGVLRGEIAALSVCRTGCGGFGGAGDIILALGHRAGFCVFIVLQMVLFLTDLDDFIIPDWTSLGGPCWACF